MTTRCKNIEDVLRSQPGGTPPEDGGAAGGEGADSGPSVEPCCSECESAAATLESARSVLLRYEPPPPPLGSRQRIWRKLEDAPGLQREARRVRGGAGGIGEAEGSFAARASDGPPGLKEETSTGGRRSRGAFGWGLLTGAAAAAAAAALLVWVVPSKDVPTVPAPAPTDVSMEESPAEAARAEQPVREHVSPLEAERPRLGSGAALVVADLRALASGARLPDEVIDVTQESRLELRFADVEAGGGARLRVSLEVESSEILELDKGFVDVEVGRSVPGASFSVSTRHGRMEVVGTRFTVETGPSTTKVEVAAGRVRVWPGSDAAVTLGPGESIRLPLEPEPPPREASRRPPDPGEAQGSSAPRASDGPLDLKDARALVETDPDHAASIATDLLRKAPDPADEVAAMAVLADAERRRGSIPAAARLYRGVADHPVGAAFAEEALVQLALLHVGSGEGDAALAALHEADARFSSGVLGPERVAIAARVHLEAGRPEAAARELEAFGRGERATLEIDHMRLLVGRALLSRDPDRAAALATAVLEGHAPPGIEQAARELLERARPTAAGE